MLYELSHILLGVLSSNYSIITPMFLSYQIAQLFYNKRFFIHDLSLKEGNDCNHTIGKIGQYMIGSFVGLIF